MKPTVIITGAGSGIGRSIAQALAQEHNYQLILIGRNEDRLLETQNSLPQPHEHKIARASVSDQKQLHASLMECGLEEVTLKGVIANAGIGGENHYGADDRWNEIISTNLTGTYLTINECLPALKRSTGIRHIVLISSVLARIGVPGYSAYCASKSGMLGLMRSLAAQYAKNSILVNAVCPGWTNTAMAKEGIELMANHTGSTYDHILQRQMTMVPTGRMSEPQEIASLVSYLFSDSQKSFTGQCFDMNNGSFMA